MYFTTAVRLCVASFWASYISHDALAARDITYMDGKRFNRGHFYVSNLKSQLNINNQVLTLRRQLCGQHFPQTLQRSLGELRLSCLMVHDAHEQLLRGGGTSWRDWLQTFEGTLVPQSLFASSLRDEERGTCSPRTEVTRWERLLRPLTGVTGNLRRPRPTFAPLTYCSRSHTGNYRPCSGSALPLKVGARIPPLRVPRRRSCQSLICYSAACNPDDRAEQAYSKHTGSEPSLEWRTKDSQKKGGVGVGGGGTGGVEVSGMLQCY